MPKRSDWEQFQREIIFALCVVVLFGLLILLAGCSLLQPADKYRAGENFGDSGATRCGYTSTVVTDLPPCR